MDAIERSAGDAMLQRGSCLRGRDPPQAVAMVRRTLSVGGASSITMPASIEPASDRSVCRPANCQSRQEIGSGTSPQAEGDFSVPASTSRRGLGGRPARRSTSPVTISNAPAARLAWMLMTVLTAPAGRPACVNPARSCSSVTTRNASGRPVISAMRPARCAPDKRSGPVGVLHRYRVQPES